MYKLDLPIDLKEVAAIERRRNREQQRQSRIFNAKVRTMGVDVAVLDKQVEERKTMEKTEKLREEAFDADREQYDKIALMLEQRERQLSQDLDQAVLNYRAQNQKPETRREFDLYDPDALKKDRPARVSDDDPRCGPASLQKFAGEDLNEEKRRELQTDMTKKWLTGQIEERKRSEAQQKYADTLYDLKRVEQDERAQHLSMMEEECRKAVDMATTSLNRALAMEASERWRLQKQQEEDNNFAEIYNHLTGDILTENPAAAVSIFGPHRVVPDRWKGMSPEQLKAILDTQKQQCQEKQRLKEEEKQQNMEWDRQRTLAARAAMNLEQEEQEIGKEMRKRLDGYNQQLSREQRAHLEYLDGVVYTNNPTAHYHSQFNTTSR
ncbi:RIB43A-like with coiled-coils protein 2 [Bufo gargarizans]|uniref:RIB43A-like with coiled-coils protein 2 n=1 Tax=Bufo gargarizans TaxID=30331 RepID=UPI001CF4E657|nr:RIB43A-like with coiled-coils protein 2 [Bufo gargarizans]XP_044124558.1 RIB43A-like with coiled-coils protein 2 [Bufo gargarizans]